MANFTRFAKSARQNYSIGKLEDSILDYKKAINLISLSIQQSSGTNNLRNRYVRVRFYAI